MTFEREPLTDQQSKEIARWISKYQIVLCNPLYRFVDRTRDSIFLALGGRGSFPREQEQPPTHYALIWQGHVIAFEGYYWPHAGATQADFDIDIAAMRMPIALKASEEDIKRIIEDAMAAYWHDRFGSAAHLHIAFPNIKTY